MILPLPAGKGAGGIGAEKQAEGRQTGNQPEAPAGYSTTTRRIRAARSKLPYRTLPPRPPPVPLPAQPRGCKGRSPLHKKTMILPLPAGKGVGGIGAEKQAKGRQTGNHPVKPPPGYRYLSPTSSAASLPAPGMQGAKPLA